MLKYLYRTCPKCKDYLGIVGSPDWLVGECRPSTGLQGEAFGMGLYSAGSYLDRDRLCDSERVDKTQ